MKKKSILKTIFATGAMVVISATSFASTEDFVFNSNYYSNKYSDLKQVFQSDEAGLRKHFWTHGVNEGRNASIGFDINYYLKHYSDLQKAFGNDHVAALKHFISNGAKEGRETSIVFNVETYLKSNPDLQKAFGNNYEAAFEHFQTNGMNEGRKTSLAFDVNTYLENNPDLQNAFGNDYEAAFEHFEKYGINEPRKTSKLFDVGTYLESNPDLQKAFGNDYEAAFEHFLTYGKNEPRATSDEFDIVAYLDNNPDLKEEFGNDYESVMEYFLENNEKEERVATVEQAEQKAIEKQKEEDQKKQEEQQTTYTSSAPATPITSKTVMNETELKDALDSDTYTTIVIGNDIDLTEKIINTKKKTINLSGKTITCKLKSDYNIENEGDLTIVGSGKIMAENAEENDESNSSSNNNYYLIYNNGKLDVTGSAKDSIIINGYYGVCTKGISTDAIATTNIQNAKILSYFVGILPYDNSNVTIKDCTINSLWYCVSGNGTQNNAVMTVDNSKLTSVEDAAIFFPSTKELNIINNSVIEGYVGIEACAGKINIEKSEIKCSVNDSSKVVDDNTIKSKTSANGTWFVPNGLTGAAILFRIQSSYGAEFESSITVDNESKLISNIGDDILVVGVNGANGTNSVKRLDIILPEDKSNFIKKDESKYVRVLKASDEMEGIVFPSED